MVSHAAGSGASMQTAADEGFELVGDPPAAAAPTAAEYRWALVLALARRLAFKRRCFGHLGAWLRHVRDRGRLQNDVAARRPA